MSSLTATGRVILGLLKFEPATGYDIKRVTDRSTRFFWRASYGQIYPELRALEAAGLVRARDEPRGRRRRRVYELTPAGERALDAWLVADDDAFEVRDEGLLRLFFRNLLDDEDLLALVRRRAQTFEEYADFFRGLAVGVGDLNDPGNDALRYGIDLMDWNAAWWRDLERKFDSAR
jgi:DNA-binding PadR family transcriptional regulator